MRTRQEVRTLAVHWRHYLYAELLNLLSQIPLIEHRRSSKRLSDLRCKESYLMDCLGQVGWVCQYTSFQGFRSHPAPLTSLLAAHQHATLISDRYEISFGAVSRLLPRYFSFMGFRPPQIPNSYHQWILVERLTPSSRTHDLMMTVVGPKLVIARAFRQWSSARRLLEKLDRTRQRGKTKMYNTHCLRRWVSILDFCRSLIWYSLAQKRSQLSQRRVSIKIHVNHGKRVRK